MLLEDIYPQFQHIISVVSFLFCLETKFFFLMINCQSLGQTTCTYHSSKRWYMYMYMYMQFEFNLMVKTVAQNAKTTKPVNLSNRNAAGMSQFLFKNLTKVFLLYMVIIGCMFFFIHPVQEQNCTQNVIFFVNFWMVGYMFFYSSLAKITRLLSFLNDTYLRYMYVWIVGSLEERFSCMQIVLSYCFNFTWNTYIIIFLLFWLKKQTIQTRQQK